MVKNAIFNALAKADAMQIASELLCDDVTLERKDFIARQIADMSKKGMMVFIVSNIAVLSFALFRMVFLSVFDYAGFDVEFLGGLKGNVHYLYLIGAMTAFYFLFMLGLTIKMPFRKAIPDGKVNNKFKKRFVFYVYLVTVTWLVVFSFYHHQIVAAHTNVRSIEAGLLVLIPITYIGAMLVIPYFTSIMLGCLVINQMLNNRIDNWLMNAIIFIFLSSFVCVVFYAVRKTINFIAEVKFKNFQLTESLVRLLTLDVLLSIPNRQAFFSRISNKLLRKKEYCSSAGILMVDVDYFKKYNDNYGHPAGDICLQQVAACLESCLREGVDMVGRYGGEEFIVFLDDVDVAGAIIVAQRIRERMAELNIEHAKSSVANHVTLSMGITCWSAGETLDVLCDQADQALYQAKRTGRNCSVVYSPEMSQESADGVNGP